MTVTLENERQLDGQPLTRPAGPQPSGLGLVTDLRRAKPLAVRRPVRKAFRRWHEERNDPVQSAGSPGTWQRPAGTSSPEELADLETVWTANRAGSAAEEVPGRRGAAKRRADIGLLPDRPVFSPMPRRKRAIKPSESRLLSAAGLNPPVFQTTFLQTLRRSFMWLYLLAYVLGGNFWDRLRRRASTERQAVRLRQGLERVGGTFVKIGQQVAMRIDLVPWEYSIELSKMLDKMPPFPLEQALAAIERTTGKPWTETFAYFDPQPAGSASIACVYQAVLKDGTKVAVKIRRPGIGELFMADFRVLDWLMELVEFVTIVRPGFTRNLRSEFRETLLEELDFTTEARFQDIFRRNAPKSGQDFFTAPKAFFEYSSEEVLVQEFVSGMWLWEVIAALEQQNPAGLAMMRELNIDPKLVAKRILWAAFWSMDENLFFHADPHPANIVIGPDSTLTFIDFGSCGSFDQEQRWALERVVLSMHKRDAQGMAKATLSLLEPFPPVDVTALMKEAEAEFVRVLYTFETKSKYTEWWERTSARQWLAMIRVASSYNLPMNLHTLRMIRATLLYDTLVLRLDSTIDRYDEYADFMKDRAKLVRKRLRRRMRRNTADDFFARLEDLAETGDDILIRAQQTASSPVASFASVVDKWIFAVSVLSRMAGRVLLLTLLAVLLASFGLYRGEADMLDVLEVVFTNKIYIILVIAIVILNVRHILFRLGDRDAR